MNRLFLARTLSPASLAVLLAMPCLLASPAGASAQEIDLTGDWLFTVESPNGTGERDVTFVQDGEDLTGDIASSRAAGPLAGRVQGNEVSFTAIVQMDSGPFEITYTGTIEDGVITGSVDFGSYGSGTFRGHRVKEPGAA